MFVVVKSCQLSAYSSQLEGACDEELRKKKEARVRNVELEIIGNEELGLRNRSDIKVRTPYSLFPIP